MARKKAASRKKAATRKKAGRKYGRDGSDITGLRPPTPEQIEAAQQRRRVERDRKIRRYLEGRRAGLLAQDAAKAAGVSRKALWVWRYRVEGFREREEQAIQDGFEAHLARLARIAEEQEASRPDTAIRATETFLRYTKGPLTRQEVSGPNGKPVEVARADPREEALAEAVERWARRLGVSVESGDAGGLESPGGPPRP